MAGRSLPGQRSADSTAKSGTRGVSGVENRAAIQRRAEALAAEREAAAASPENRALLAADEAEAQERRLAHAQAALERAKNPYAPRPGDGSATVHATTSISPMPPPIADSYGGAAIGAEAYVGAAAVDEGAPAAGPTGFAALEAKAKANPIATGVVFLLMGLVARRVIK